MFKELEEARKDPAPDGPGPKGVCECVCGEPAPADAGEAPVGDRSLVYAQQYWDING